MEEAEYRNTYCEINERQCVFEKAVNSRVCNCGKAQRFNLADREGVACQSSNAQVRCANLLDLLHTNARFTLQLTHISGPLPHNAEIKVQNGGLLGVVKVCSEQDELADEVSDIFMALSEAEQKFGSLEQLPFARIVQIIAGYDLRRRRGK